MTEKDANSRIDNLWQLLIALRWRVDAGHAPPYEMGAADGETWSFDGDRLRPLGGRQAEQGEEALLSQFLPLAAAPASGIAIGQLGQSLDGAIATAQGLSHYVTGPQSLVHLHRLRALSDAVVVGRVTVEADNPRLTTRHVAGPSPMRIVLDREGRLDPECAVFTGNPGAALRITASETPEIEGVETLVLPAGPDGFDPMALREALGARGLRRLLIEGGGKLVTSWLQAGQLDRLHLVVAPLFLGSGARKGIDLPPPRDLAAALRPRALSYPLGGDVLFDLDLGSGKADG